MENSAAAKSGMDFYFSPRYFPLVEIRRKEKEVDSLVVWLIPTLDFSDFTFYLMLFFYPRYLHLRYGRD